MAGRRANHEGSIYQRESDGKWCASVTLPGGQRKVIYGRTREEVSRKLIKLLGSVQDGQPVRTDERLTVGAYLDRWLEEAVQPRVRRRTYDFYEGHVRLYLKPPLGRVRLTQLTVLQVQAMLNGLQDRVSPRTVQYARATLRTALNRAIKWGLLARNVAALADPPAAPRHEIEPLSVDEARTLLAAAVRPRPGLLGEHGHRLAHLLVVALSTGLRSGELLGLRWGDVDLERGALSVRASLERLPRRTRPQEAQGAEDAWRLTAPKSDRARRTLPLTMGARAALVAQKRAVTRMRVLCGPRWCEQPGGERGGFVFPSTVGTPLSHRNVYREYQALLAEAGLPPKRFHDLRHTCASFLQASGADLRTVMAVLGHSQISHTADTYTHLLPAVLDEAAAKLDALLAAATEDATDDPAHSAPAPAPPASRARGGA